jgi:hypothetical protein
MSAEPPPSGGNSGYNPDDWTNANDPIDNQYLAQNYLQFPFAQGAEILATTTVSGTLTVQDTATFSDIVNVNALATFNKGIDITTTDGIIFSDNTVQTTAFIEANYAQLNTDNTFLAPFQNTFAGNASTGNANAPIKLTNGVAGEFATLYLNPSSGEDITLYSNQTVGGGLTLRGANGSSFTMNPNSVQGGSGCQMLNPLSMNGSTLSGLNNVYGNAGGTITFQDIANFNSGATLTTTPTSLQTTNVANVDYVNSSISTSLIPYSTTSQMNTSISTALIPYSNTVQMNSAISTATSGLAPINSPTFTGTPLLTTTPTAGITNPSAVANLQYITNQGFAPLASPALTGTPTAPTQPANSTNGTIANVNYVNNAIASIPAGAVIQSGQLNGCSISGNVLSGSSGGYVQNDYICRSSYTIDLAALGLQTYSSNTAYVATAELSNIAFTLASGYLQMIYGIWVSVNTNSGSTFTISVFCSVHVNNPANNVDGMPTFNLVWHTSPRL